MDITEAFVVLELSSSATEEEIQEAFRGRARDAHPDSGGNHEAMSQLNKARDIAVAYARTRLAVVVPPELMEVMARTRDNTTLALLREDTQAVKDAILRHRIDRIKQYRNMSVLVAAIGAIIPYVVSISPTPLPVFGGLMLPLAAFFLAGIGVMYWMYSNSANAIEFVVKELTDYLSDRANYITLFRQLTIAAVLPQFWRVAELEQNINKWLGARYRPNNEPFTPILVLFPRESVDIRSIIATIGQDGVAKLLVAKGKEHKLITEQTTFEDDRYVTRYSYTLLEATEPAE